MEPPTVPSLSSLSNWFKSGIDITNTQPCPSSLFSHVRQTNQRQHREPFRFPSCSSIQHAGTALLLLSLTRVGPFNLLRHLGVRSPPAWCWEKNSDSCVHRHIKSRRRNGCRAGRNAAAILGRSFYSELNECRLLRRTKKEKRIINKFELRSREKRCRSIAQLIPALIAGLYWTGVGGLLFTSKI